MNEQTQVGNVSIGDTQYQGGQRELNDACPCCGYCPHCGRRNTQPWVPQYPWAVPFSPYTWPTTICGGGYAGSNLTGAVSSVQTVN